MLHVALLAALSASPADPPAGERYYIILFGAQSVPYRNPLTHTWATFVRTAAGPDGERPVEVFTISWLPATLRVRPHALRPEPGVNLTLDQTYAWVGSFGGRVSVWGAFEITPDRYAMYAARKAELEGGAVAYRALGTFTRDPAVSNCGQSFTLAAPRLRQRYTQPTPFPGENGTSRLVERYMRVRGFADPTPREWLLAPVGVDTYPTTRRQPGERVPYFRR